MTATEKTLDIRRPSKWVAEVWLNRPDVRNAFNDSVIAELTQAFQQLGQDKDLRAIVLSAVRLRLSRNAEQYSWQSRSDPGRYQIIRRCYRPSDQHSLSMAGRRNKNSHAF